MESTPTDINASEVREKLKAVTGAREITDLHIWALSQSSKFLTVHIKAENPEEAYRKAKKLCKSYKIWKSSIEVEKAV